jgi:hypothetical protein
MGVLAGRQLDGAAGREAGTDERVESGLTTFLTECGRVRTWARVLGVVEEEEDISPGL